MQINLKPDIKDGLTQSERFSLSLDPAYYKIDERDIDDFLNIAAELSGKFIYYNFNNEPSGSWDNFFTSDIDILIALISRLDIKSYSIKFTELVNEVTNSVSDDEAIAGIKKVFSFLNEFASLQLKYNSKFQVAGSSNTAHGDISAIKEAIQSFDDEISTLVLYNRQAAKTFKIEINTSDSYLTYSADDAGGKIFDKGNLAIEKIFYSVTDLEELFSNFRKKYIGLTAVCKFYLENLKSDGNVYEPHIALFVSFLHLYKYLQTPLNDLLKKHLDFYYQEVIGMKPKGAMPDKVHIILELAVNVNRVRLQKGELLFAEIAEKQQRLFYQLEDDIEITKTKVKELKTLFLSDKSSTIGRKDNKAYEIQVYQGNYRARDAAEYLKEKEQVNPWPLFGEDQSELPEEELTMQKADIGLLIASPLLYHKDGNRHFQIKIFIPVASFKLFKDYTDEYAKFIEKNENILLHDVLNEAFIIDITTENGWLNIINFNVKSNYDTIKESSIEINFKLKANEPPVTVYNSKVHGFDFKIKWPVVRLMINNSSFYNPYIFFSNLGIERISIRTDVTDSKDFKLKNTFGDLNASNPFQPFGPLPAIGSYLDIKNTNIFNSYTLDFYIRIRWLSLPREEDGFETYYKEYKKDIKNHSFQVALNSPVDGRFTSDTERQQRFNLFSTYRNENGRTYLNNTSTLSVKGVREIRFKNPLRLDEEYNKSEAFFEEGTVRLELISPPEAFGHRIYPQIFSETALYNSRKSSQKIAAPNPPYVPVVKSLTIDYTLAHTELLMSAENTETPNSENLCLIHCYPFGYSYLYPGKGEEYLFIPSFDQRSNLYIGLSSLIPGQELSLFFQLDEKNFHHTAHEPDKIEWSYLLQNKWKPFGRYDVYGDTTNRFLNSGLIKLKAPDDIETGNTILNPSLFWIRVSIATASSVMPGLIALFAQGASVVLAPDEQGVYKPDNTLGVGMIKEFKRKIPEIQNIYQPFSFFNGRLAETYRQYIVRVSERLRHKQRPLTSLDISQVVLDKFPNILMVKCFGAGENNTEMMPGRDIHVIVIPKEKEDGGFISQEPKVNLSTLNEIKGFIEKSISGFINIEVGNPVYEKIKVVCSVKIKKQNGTGESDGFYIKQLNKDIKEFISPWLYHATKDFEIGTKLYISEILSFIQKRCYIDTVTGFSVLHFYRRKHAGEKFYAKMIDSSKDKINGFFKGSVPEAILISSKNHWITIIKEAEIDLPMRSGIGNLAIGSEMFIASTDGEKADKPISNETDNMYDFTVIL